MSFNFHVLNLRFPSTHPPLPFLPWQLPRSPLLEGSPTCVLRGLYFPWTCLPRTVKTNRSEPGFKEHRSFSHLHSCFSSNKQVSRAHQATGAGAKAPGLDEPSGRGRGGRRCWALTWFEQRPPRGVEPEDVWGGVGG